MQCIQFRQLRASQSDRYRLLVEIIQASVVCRSLPSTLRISVSPLGKTDAQIQVTRVGFVPTRDTRCKILGSKLRLGRTIGRPKKPPPLRGVGKLIPLEY
jgi:hypothetical protein